MLRQKLPSSPPILLRRQRGVNVLVAAIASATVAEGVEKVVAVAGDVVVAVVETNVKRKNSKKNSCKSIVSRAW